MSSGRESFSTTPGLRHTLEVSVGQSKEDVGRAERSGGFAMGDVSRGVCQRGGKKPTRAWSGPSRRGEQNWVGGDKKTGSENSADCNIKL